MLSTEDFTKRVLDSFDNIREEIGELRKEVGKIHDCQTRLESQFQTHLRVEEALEKQEKDKKTLNNNKFYVIIAVLTTVFTAISTYALFR